MKADRLATLSRCFKDPKSYVCPDGREILHGEDWEERKFELLKRCHGQCEYMMVRMRLNIEEPTHVRCSREAADPHHNVLRSIKRDDRLDKLTALCRHHHIIVDREQRKAKRERRGPQETSPRIGVCREKELASQSEVK
jgi:hypothetical protein